jgi:serine/threonine-protein kinase RsbW
VRIVSPRHQRVGRRLTLRADLSELRRLAQWIEAQTWPGSSPDVAFAISLCLEEAVANIIMHGSVEGDALKIAVEIERAAGTLTARIEDNGRRFDPTRAPPPESAASLKDAKVGGLGISLIRDFASGMRYERRDGHNRLTLQFFEAAPVSRGVG